MRVKDGKVFELVGLYEKPIYGYKQGVVSDLGELSESIRTTIADLTKKTGVKIKGVQLGLGGELVSSRETSTVIPLADRGSKVITTQDLKKLNVQAKLLGIKMEEEILHQLSQYYQVDDANLIVNPIGLYGRKLGVYSLMIIAQTNRVRNIIKAVHQAGYEVVNVFFSSYAASEVILCEEDLLEGCALVDIGANGTNILVFKDKVLKYLDKIDVGGSLFTKGISDKLNLSFSLAEEIKKSYAVALSSERHHEEEILVKKENNYIPVKRGDIYRAIEPDILKLVTGIRTAIKFAGLYGQIHRGVVMIGGGSLMPGLIERIAEEMDLPAYLGNSQITLEKKLSHTALYSSVLGLTHGGFKGTLAHSIMNKNGSSWKSFLIGKVKEVYHEYF